MIFVSLYTCEYKFKVIFTLLCPTLSEITLAGKFLFQISYIKKYKLYIIPSQINQIFKKICREVGIKTNLVTGCNTHMTKHTFVTRAIESGISLLTISKLVRTSVRELEKTYTYVLHKFMKVELEGLRKHLKNSKIIAFPKAKKAIS